MSITTGEEKIILLYGQATASSPIWQHYGETTQPIYMKLIHMMYFTILFNIIVLVSPKMLISKKYLPFLWIIVSGRKKHDLEDMCLDIKQVTMVSGLKFKDTPHQRTSAFCKKSNIPSQINCLRNWVGCTVHCSLFEYSCYNTQKFNILFTF